MIRRFALASALFVAVGSAAPSMAVAGSSTSGLDMSASVSNNCTISAYGMSFGTYSPTTGSRVTGTVKTNCTLAASPVITLDQGSYRATNSSDTAPLRRLKNSGSDNYLSYTLYQDYEKTAIWGNSTSTGVTVLGTGSEQSTSVYGETPAGQSVPAGYYTDTVTATIAF